MGWQSDALTGVAAYLASHGAGTWTPNAAGGTIVRGSLPDEVDQGVGVRGYRAAADDVANATTELRIQLYLRAAQDAIDDLDSLCYDALHGLAGLALGAATVTLTRSISAVPMGVDGRGREERACNYALDLDLPSTALRS